MSIWEALFLGIVQGLTEFLPISSSGHLVIFQKLLGLAEHDLTYDVVAHLGTLLSVVVVYRKVLGEIGSDLFTSLKSQKMTEGLKLMVFIVLATLPTGLMGLIFKDLFESLFNQLTAVGFFLMVTGVLLFATRRFSGGGFDQVSVQALNSQLSYKKALAIGFFQGLAITPGISRSGTTIATGLFLKLDKNSAALFSFMIAIPAILGAVVLQLRDVQWSAESLGYLGAGFVSAFLFGWLGLSAILAAIRRGRLDIFSVYLWTVGLACILAGLL